MPDVFAIALTRLLEQWLRGDLTPTQAARRVRLAVPRWARETTGYHER